MTLTPADALWIFVASIFGSLIVFRWIPELLRLRRVQKKVKQMQDLVDQKPFTREHETEFSRLHQEVSEDLDCS